MKQNMKRFQLYITMAQFNRLKKLSKKDRQGRSMAEFVRHAIDEQYKDE